MRRNKIDVCRGVFVVDVELYHHMFKIVPFRL